MNNVILFPALRTSKPVEADIPAIVELVHDCWHEVYDDHLPLELSQQRTAEAFSKLLAPKLANATVVRRGNEIIGYADHLSNCIDNLWVTKSYRRRGIGKLLLDIQLDELKTKGMDSVQAGCESFNEAAIGFYGHHGWNVIDETVETIVPGLDVGVITYGYRIAS